MRNQLHYVIKCGSMPQLSRYHTLHVTMREMREMRIWPQYAAKCCKNAGKFFPDVVNYIGSILIYITPPLQAIRSPNIVTNRYRSFFYLHSIYSYFTVNSKRTILGRITYVTALRL